MAIKYESLISRTDTGDSLQTHENCKIELNEKWSKTEKENDSSLFLSSKVWSSISAIPVAEIFAERSWLWGKLGMHNKSCQEKLIK